MLKMITMTGADDTTEPQALCDLSADYKFVEWGILASNSQAGSGRFPSIDWIDELRKHAMVRDEFNMCLHLCGSWVRKLLIGDIAIPARMAVGFQRMQLNFHAENTLCYGLPFWHALLLLGQHNRQFIFQIDGAGGNKHLEEIYKLSAASIEGKVDAVPLFDVSGGAGVLPKEWPTPKYVTTNNSVSSLVLHGYAGGLGPHNLAVELPKIIAAAGDCDIWIDMETHVRTDEKFDLDKVEACLKICKPYFN